MEEPTLFLLRDVAAKTGISERSLADAARANKMPHYKINGRRYMSQPQIDAYLAASLVGPRPAPVLSKEEIKAKFLAMHNRRTPKG